MTTTHTQGLLLAEQYRLVTKDGAIPVAEASMHSTLAESTDQMRRLAACWNAFEGVATDEIEGKDLAEIVAGMAYLTGMQGGTLGLEGGACGMLASQFAGQFKGSNAVNFLEVRMDHKETGPFTVTMQRTQGETPGQQLAALKAEIAALQAQRAGLLAALLELRDGGWLNFIFDEVAKETRGERLSIAYAAGCKARGAIIDAQGGAA